MIRFFLRVSIFALAGLFVWTCNVADSRKPDTLTFRVNDSLKTSSGKYDSIELDLYTIHGKDTVFKKILFRGKYTDASQLVNLPLGEGVSGDFEIRVIGFRDKKKVLEVAVPFSGGTPAEKAIIYIAPDSVPHKTNHAPTLSFGASNPGSSFRLKEGRTISLHIAAVDPDSGDLVTLLSPLDAPWPLCGKGGYDTSTGNLSFTPSFQCVAFGESTFFDLVFKARDNGTPPETGQITTRITVEDSNSAPKWKQDSVDVQGKEGREIGLDLSHLYLGDDEKDSVVFTSTCGSADKTALKWTFTPGFRDAGQKDCEIVATDSHLPAASSKLTLALSISDSIRAIDVAITAPVKGFISKDSIVIVKWVIGSQVQSKDTTEKLKAEGPNTIKRTFTDSIGNTGSDSITVILDTKPPLPPKVQSLALTNNPKPKWTWQPGSGGNGQFRVRVDSTDMSRGTTAVIDTAFIPSNNLSHGRHVLFVQERDAAGNWSATDSGVVQVDLVAPVVKITSPLDGHVTNQGTIDILWTVDGKAQQKISKSLNENENTFAVSAVDSAGNSDTVTIKVTRKSNVIFVNGTASVEGNGNSWATPYKYLRTALAIATDGEIWVAKGTYKPGDGNNEDSASFRLKMRVNLFGGFLGSENSREKRDWIANESILSGERGDPSSLTDNTGPVVLGNAFVIFDGFVVERGYNYLASAMLNEDVSPEVSNCTFRDNLSDRFTGKAAMVNSGGNASPTIKNCLFLRNAGGEGGAMNNINGSPTISNCIFRENQNGAVWNNSGSPIITSCLFINNEEAIFEGGTSTTILNTAFIGNTSTAIHVVSPGLTMKNCILADNSGRVGGGMQVFGPSINLINCDFYGNSASDSGGGIAFGEGSSAVSNPKIKNCIFWGNTATLAGSQISIQSNSTSTFTLDVSYSNLINNSASIGKPSSAILNWGSGNIQSDPLFNSPGNIPGPDGKYFTSDDGLVLGASPAVGGGDPTGTTPTDITGAPRIQGGRIDMGAYEQ
ncbi:MAG: hypothetical protein JWO30_2004 [Fibrobacteres bacterium]|nr:hypothetical protein [Fibrobacterota bacterium]